MGSAEPYLYPPPLNFTTLRGRGISGGILYYQIMNGITGTGMPYFKGELESEKIWDVGVVCGRRPSSAKVMPTRSPAA